MLETESAELVANNPTPEVFREEMLRVFCSGNDPRTFFTKLSIEGVLDEVSPRLSELDCVPAGPEQHHKEGTAFVHTMNVLWEMYRLRGNRPRYLLAALSHDIGKSATPEENLPNHPKHTKRGKHMARELGEELGLEEGYIQVMESAARYHMRVNKISELRAKTLLDMAKELGWGTSNPKISIDELIALGISDDRGRMPRKDILDKEKIRQEMENAVSALEEISRENIMEEKELDESSDALEQVLIQRRVEFLQERRN